MNSVQTIKMRKTIARYRQSDNKQAFFQLLNTFIPYIVLWLGMIHFLESAPWLSFFLSLALGFLHLRIFVLQHDCGHNSFFSRSPWNSLLGNLLAVFTLTSFENWRNEHNKHHSSTGNLNKRGQGDIWLMSCREFESSSPWKKVRYRIYRHPLSLFVVGPLFYFLIRRRFPVHLDKSMKKARANLLATNIVLFFVYGMLFWIFGWKNMMLLFLPIFFVSSSVGVWLFYVQHHFEEAYWKSPEQWEVFDAAFEGSSYYDLPRFLHWVTADIAVHHIHHLDARVPNYRLRECMEDNPELAPKVRITFLESLECMRFRLWDEEKSKLVGFA